MKATTAMLDHIGMADPWRRNGMVDLFSSDIDIDLVEGDEVLLHYRAGAGLLRYGLLIE